MPLKNRTGVEVLKLQGLTKAEIDHVVHALRYQDAELKDHGDVGEENERLREPIPLERELTLTMSVEDALAELRRAEREERLLIEWKRGWLYFFYCPPDDDPEYFAGMDMREFLTRVPQPKGQRRRDRARLDS